MSLKEGAIHRVDTTKMFFRGGDDGLERRGVFGFISSMTEMNNAMTLLTDDENASQPRDGVVTWFS
jgi:hypothetical protein